MERQPEDNEPVHEINLSDLTEAKFAGIEAVIVGRFQSLVNDTKAVVLPRIEAVKDMVAPRVTAAVELARPRVEAFWKAVTRQDVQELREALEFVLRGGPVASPGARQRIVDAKVVIAAETVDVGVTNLIITDVNSPVEMRA